MHSLTEPATAYRRQPIRRTLRGIGRAITWLDRRMSEHRWLKRFVLLFIGLSLIVPATIGAVYPWYELLTNRSDSLPGTLYLLDKTRPPHCGDTTAFDMPVDARFYRGHRLIKIIKGCPGDVVRVNGQQVFVNGDPVGSWQEFSTQGHHKLFPTDGGVIPEGKVYLYATHPRSYDSRYRSFGLRDRDELLGTATRIF